MAGRKKGRRGGAPLAAGHRRRNESGQFAGHAGGSGVRAVDRRHAERSFPGDGLLGEEGARAESRSGRRWIIDPIDGTRDYLRGNALWANLIALEVDGKWWLASSICRCWAALYKASRGAGRIATIRAFMCRRKDTVEESVLCFNQFDRLERVPFHASTS